MKVDSIEWTNDASLPSEVDVPIDEFKHYMQIADYLKKTYNDSPKAFRYRANGLINFVRF